MSDLTEGRQARMIAAAVWLAEQGFARIGWAPSSDGKAPIRHWKSDATDDPALVPGILRGARNALVIPVGRAIIIDADDERAWGELEAAGLPPTLRIDSPTAGHGHAYGWVPDGIDMTTIPGSFAWGEIRRPDPKTGTASMVLGPFARRSDGVYEPSGGAIATFPESVIEYLIASRREQDVTRSSARGPEDPGWAITNGRHQFIVSKARNLRGVGLSGERLFDELVRIDRERCSPPLADDPREGIDEIRRLADWTDVNIKDDPPPITIVSGALPHLTARQLAAETPESVPWRAFGVADGAITEVDGKPKAAGKTTFLCGMAGAVLDGIAFLGRPTVRTPIVFMSEQGRTSLRATLTRAGLDDRDDLYVVLWHDTRGLDWPALVDAAAALCRDKDARLLIVDTLPQFARLAGDAENDAGAALAAMAPLQAAAASGLAVVISRHDRKSGGEVGDSARGSGAFTGTVDVVLGLRRGDPGEPPTVRHLHGLSRFDEVPDEVIIEWTPDGYVLHGTAAAFAAGEARESVLAALVDDASLTMAELVTATEAKRTTVRAAVDGLIADGSVIRDGAGKRGDPFRFSLSGILADPSPETNATNGKLSGGPIYVGTYRAAEKPSDVSPDTAAPESPVNGRAADDLTPQAAAIFGDMLEAQV